MTAKIEDISDICKFFSGNLFFSRVLLPGSYFRYRWITAILSRVEAIRPRVGFLLLLLPCFPPPPHPSATKDFTAFFANVISGWSPAANQNTEALLKAQDLQVAKISGTAFAMAHSMGLANIKMAAATAANSKETLTLTANTTTEAYSSSTSDNAFYALDEFATNLPYKQGTRNTASLDCYFIVNPSKSYTFSTTYKYADNDANRQWNNLIVSSSSNTVAKGKYKEITTTVPKFKNLGRLYSYTGNSQTYTPVLSGKKYQMECWGAGGGRGSWWAENVTANNGHGAYVAGIITLGGESMYVYVGGQGVGGDDTQPAGGWNGGGKVGNERADGSGGGATDIRLNKCTSDTNWSEFASIITRIIVASGGGGSDDYEGSQRTYYGGGPEIGGIYACGAGLYAPSATITDMGIKTGATQTSPGKYKDTRSAYASENSGGFGYGNKTVELLEESNRANWAGGGSGYWGAAGSDAGGMGGTSFISGHEGCVALKNGNAADEEHLVFRNDENAIDKSKHYSGYYFENTKMIDGGGKSWTTTQGDYEAMPSPASTSSYYPKGDGSAAAGNPGNGYARITCMPYD